ncbi:HAMP domain-containing sensor histidine kinase [Telluribacter sp.]|jgi:signal transduction histidine kinase|uniref:HAMP domain-containing sensor histidine kinase n=1 Tax=Telluribacter sp. TaxID=1978767 RepID=UPI002E0EE70B|nr:HAMP domain-containing sensor histidine kinase [Telluribacter sp.]
MKIKDRIALQFSLIVASILVIFSVIVYTISSNYRQEEFYDRLMNKARTTARLLVDVEEIDKELLKIIDRNTLTALIDEKVLVFDSKNQLIYASVDDKELLFRPSLLEEIRKKKEIVTTEGENEIVGLLYDDGQEPLVVLASAYDKFGRSKLQNLGNTLLWGLLVGIGLTVALGIYFAGNSLKPIAHINEQVSSITARNLQQHLDEGNRRDEIAQLAINFNTVLKRLHQAFEQQKSFVSHASHELRTPLAALKSEVQLAERFAKDDPEIKVIFQNLATDTDRLISITNSLLFLARSFENISQMTTTRVRIEDIAFLAKEELLDAHPAYQLVIDYENLPANENDTLVEGNEELLKRVFLNLMDNACKYSPDQTARVLFSTDSTYCYLKVIDQGIGIAPADQPHIFEPFYRASNAAPYSGFGIGLSISQRIVDIHGGTLTVESNKEEGSTFTVQLTHV